MSMEFQDLQSEYDLDLYLRNLINTSIKNQNFSFMTRKDYFLFDNPIYVNYIIEDYQCIKDFFIKIISEYIGSDNFDPGLQVMFLSPHEAINFKSRIETKDRKLPLFVIKVDSLPQIETISSGHIYRMESPYFMYSTQNKTKSFIMNQYKQIYEQNDPKYTREQFRNKIFSTLYFDQVTSVQNVSLEIYQESNIELQTLFQNFNTKLFVNRTRKDHYVIQIDTLIRNSNEQFVDIQNRFSFPLFYVINYYVDWTAYSNITQFEKQQFNLQKQKLEFKFNLSPITRFNLSGTLLNIDIDLGVLNKRLEFFENDGEKLSDIDLVEWLRKYKLK